MAPASTDRLGFGNVSGMGSDQVFVAVVQVLLLALPWLNPVTFGPTHPVIQGVAVWFCAAFCWMLSAVHPQPFHQKVAKIAYAWSLAATVSAGIGLVQYFGLSEHFSPFVNYLDAGQAFGNLRQRNQLATLLAIGACTLLWVARPGKDPCSHMSRFRSDGAWLLSAGLLASADAASGSRTGLLQLLLLLSFRMVWRSQRARAGALLTAYVFAAVLLPQLAGLGLLDGGILGRVGEHVPACASRLTLWRNVVELVLQKPWLGWGWGELAYAHFVTLYPGARFCQILGNAHNLPLHIAVEMGVPAAALFCAAIAWLVVRQKPWAETNPTRQMAWSVLGVIGLHSLLEYPLWYGPFQLAAMLAIWILWCTRSSLSQTVPSVRRQWPWAMAVGICVTCAFVTWDYWRISQIYLPVSQRSLAYREDTLMKASNSWLFQSQIKFATLGITPLDASNAEQMHALALDLLHFSPEASVVQKLIDSARLLGMRDEAQYYVVRFRAAYPKEYAEWIASCKQFGLGGGMPDSCD